jgi:hypothetical protein
MTIMVLTRMAIMRLVASNHNGTTLLVVLYIPLVFDGIKVTVLLGVIHCSLQRH